MNKVKDAKGVCGDLSQMIWGGEGVNGADSAGDQQEIRTILDGICNTYENFAQGAKRDGGSSPFQRGWWCTYFKWRLQSTRG